MKKKKKANKRKTKERQGKKQKYFSPKASLASDSKAEFVKNIYEVGGVTTNTLKQYLNGLAELPLLTPEEEKTLARKWRAKNDEKALNRLIEGNLRFVIVMVKKYKKYTKLSFADLINEGNLGLVQAARKFDAAKNVRFISYAVWWIRQAIMNAITDSERPFRLPPKKELLSRKIAKTAQKLRQKYESEPTLAEIAQDAGLKQSEIKDLGPIREESLDAILNDETGYKLLDSISQTTEPSPDDKLCNKMLSNYINHLLNGLRTREQEVLKMRFGFEDGKALTLEEIGKKMGLSRERVRQIEKTALLKLKRTKTAMHLKSFLN